MQDPKSPKTRKPWYRRALQMATLWKIIFKAPTSTNSTIWKAIAPTDIQPSPNTNKQTKLRKSSSLKVATTTFTRVCLCAPIGYTEVFSADYVPPRRSYSYPRSKQYTSPPNGQEIMMRVPSARHSIDGRRVFRGKSLTDDILMRRFVIAEEAMSQVRRRNQMEIIRKRAAMRRKKLGPSPLSRMALAQIDERL